MSEVLDPPLTHPVSPALDALSAALHRLAGAAAGDASGQLWTLSSAELVESTAALHRLVNQADAVLHALVREVDVRGAATDIGAPSTAAWLRHRLRLHPATARRLVETARALHDEPAGSLVPLAGTAEQTSAVSGRASLRTAFADGDISADHAQVVCRTLADLPPVDVDTTDRAAAFLAEQAKQHDPSALAHLGKHLRHVLDPDAGDSLARDEEHATSTQSLVLRRRSDGGSNVRGSLGPELSAALLSQLSPLAAPLPAVDGVKDLRTVGQRQADALAELLRRYAVAGLAPTTRGAATTVTVVMSLETLRRRLACDARIIPAVLGANGEPLDVGRASYPVTQAIRRAMVVRDRGCAFAGCTRPPEWTDAHHIVHWEDGGSTSVDNCCLLCAFHHRAVHHHGWALELVDGRIWTVPPPWVDPAQTPRRHTGRAQLADLDLAEFGHHIDDS